MNKKILILSGLYGVLALSYAIASESMNIQKNKSEFFNVYLLKAKISQSSLPAPYDYLLTQPLMTKGLETYYQRTPIIQTIKAVKNQQDNTYHRVIKMLVDGIKARNNIKLALRKKEEKVIELAFITMNFDELPKKIIYKVLHSNIPFGQLLSENHVMISNQDRSYFTVPCNQLLKALMNCQLNSTLYGRTNTIIKADNHQWLAHVVEILAAP
jgi:hypothetical protein